MSMFSDFINTYRGYIPYIAAFICCLGVVLALMALWMFSHGSQVKNPLHPKSVGTAKRRSKRSIEEAFKELHEERVPVLSSKIASFLVASGVMNVGPILASFFRIMRILKKSTFEKNWEYRLPWYLLLGPKDSGKSTMLNGLSFMPLSGSEKVHDDIWHLYDNGVIFEAPSNLLMEDDLKFWDFFCGLFRYFRPRRPLDGIILALPADLLMKKDHHELNKLARETVYKIADLQKNINLRVPIYIVVTKSDKIHGFSEFCSELSPSEKGQIIGWSSEKGMDEVIQKNWLKDAIGIVSSGLRRASLALAQNKKVSGVLENAIFLKYGVESILDSMHTYVDTLNKQTDKSLFLVIRGIYFTALNQEKITHVPSLHLNALNPMTVENKMSSVGESSHFGVCFADDLFREKIFKECNLAVPINLSKLEADKVTWAKRGIAVALSAAWSIGWYVNSDKINREIKSAETTLKTAVSLMRRINILESNIRDHTDQKILNQEIRKMFQVISGIRRENLTSIFVPGSWFSRVPSRIASTVGIIFDSSATKAVFLDLSLNAKIAGTGISASSGKQSKEKKGNPFDISKSSSYLEFKAFVEKIAKLEKMEEEYNRIRKMGDPEAINNITKEMFKETFNVSRLLQDRTPDQKFVAPQFDLSKFQKHLQKNAVTLFRRFLSDTFDNTIEKIFEKLMEDINTFAYIAQQSKESYSTNEMAQLYGKVVAISEIVESEKFKWLRSSSFVPTEDYLVLFSNIEMCNTLGHELSRELLDIANEEFKKLKDKLLSFATTFTGPLFSKSLSISDGLEKFKKELEIIVKEPFTVKVLPKEFVRNVSVDQILNWDAKIVKEAAGIIEKVEDFELNKLKLLRSEFQPIYKEIVKKCVYPCIMSILAKAQIIEDAPNGSTTQQMETALRKHASNLSGLIAYLPKLVTFLDERASVGLPDYGFAELIVEQSKHIIEAVDAIFEVGKPYAAGEGVFEDWNGDGAPVFAGTRDPEEVKKYLASQYNRVKSLARDVASSAINVLSLENFSNRLSYSNVVEKWKDIVSQVEEVEQGKPGSSISMLEAFILSIVSETNLRSLQSDVSIGDIAKKSGNYFVNQRAKLAKALLARAAEINIQRAVDSYNTLSDYFNSQIAGKFPFGSTSPDEVSINAMENLISMYESAPVDIASVMQKNAANKGIPDNIITFLQNLVTAFDFLKTWIEHSKNTDPENALVGFMIDPRVNSSYEQMGSMVLERNIIVNGLEQEEEVIILHNGDSFEVALPLAQNNSVELHQGSSNNMNVSNGKVTFTYDGAWCFLRMIEHHKIDKSSTSTNGAVLEFGIPVTVEENGEARDSKIKVFMKITPVKRSSGGAWTPMAIPLFPSEAPKMPALNF